MMKGNTITSFTVGDHELNIKGTLPTSGTLLLNNGEVVSASLEYTDFTSVFDGNEVTVNKGLPDNITTLSNTVWIMNDTVTEYDGVFKNWGSLDSVHLFDSEDYTTYLGMFYWESIADPTIYNYSNEIHIGTKYGVDFLCALGYDTEYVLMYAPENSFGFEPGWYMYPSNTTESNPMLAVVPIGPIKIYFESKTELDLEGSLNMTEYAYDNLVDQTIIDWFTENGTRTTKDFNHFDITLTKTTFENPRISWLQITKAVRLGKYNKTLSSDLIGAERTIKVGEIESDAIYSNSTYESVTYPDRDLKVRVANVTPCTNALESKSACGFVVEFSEVIVLYPFDKLTTSTGYNDSDMMSLVTWLPAKIGPQVFYSEISYYDDIVSGRKNGSSTYDTEEYSTYLLTASEIFSDASSIDNVSQYTRQLDYYAKLGVTTSNITAARKKLGDTYTPWVLRTPAASGNKYYVVGETLYTEDEYIPVGVSIAFKIRDTIEVGYR